MKDEIDWLRRFLNASVFGPPPSEIQRAHAIVDRLVDSSGESEDTERLRYLANEPICDEYAGIDLHEEAAICASAFGREEPNSNDYLAAFRTAIDAAMRSGLSPEKS